MDPFAIQAGASQGVRPVLALDASLTSVLREGRMVAGEVLQSFDGHSLLIGVGRHRVPADSHVEMQPGDRFLARVTETKDGIVLKVLGGPAGDDSKLLIALRSVLAQDRPVGELLEDVASRIRSAIEGRSGSEKSLADLLRQLGEHVYLPGSSAGELRDLLARSGIDYEALLLAESQGGKAAVQVRGALSALVRQLLTGLEAQLTQLGLHLSQVQLKDLKQRFLRALADLTLPAGSEKSQSGGATLRAELELRLTRALEAGVAGRSREALRAALPQRLDLLLEEMDDSDALQNLLRALSGAGDPISLARNLKAQLLTALATLSEGEVRDSVARAVAGLESEQLLNLARREFREGWHLSLPVPDGERWATAHLFYSDPDADERHQPSSPEDMQRLSVAVEFSKIGPLRAEIGVRDDLVALRLTVTQDDVATQLRNELPKLLDKLSVDGREARVSIALGSKEDARIERLSTDIRWFQEHHLMDLSG